MHHPKAKQKLMSLAVAAACSALIAQAYAQETAVAQTSGVEPPSPMQTVTVSGLRASLQSSMNLKRNADGIVDGIVAEDIGKFPDTNLAESLQRISGVSIDRSNGEGQKVTVRGVGPDFNLVLLNGRQMPTSNLGDLNGRAFDFSNLASEAISQIQVYKSSRAETPTGGIGATLNVLTARPLDRPGQRGSIGVKGVYDTSNNNLPGDVKANHSYTPEISGIYSNTFGPDNQFGIALSASYQERNLGFNTAAVSNGWRGPFRGDENNWGTIPQAGTPDAAGITNRPKPGDIYSVPQNLNYNMNGVQRQRTNGQLTLQWQPIKSLTTTLDYTYSENKIQSKRNDISAWFNFGPSTSSWSNGPVAAPLVYTELIPAGNSDIAMGAADFATRTQNKSLGFNAAWKPTNDLRLEIDTHHSTAESMADSPFGSSNTLGTASFSRGNTSADFTHDFPILSIDGADFNKARQQVTGSVFQNGYMKGKIDQTQFRGNWKVMEASNLNFGAAHIKVDNRSAFSTQQRDTWGGATKPEDYPSSVWHQDSVRQYFDNIKGSDSSKLFNTFYTFNFAEVRALAAKASGLPDLYLPKTTFDTDRRTKETSKSGYIQLGTDWEVFVPMHTNIGVRYETTDVVSSALVPTPVSITMVSANEFPVQFGPAAFTTLTGKYSHWLPSIDWDADLRSDIKVRASYGETIGRPRYDQIQGGKTIDNLARVNGGTGSQGNPALKPVKSKNTDLSGEWYYNDQSFASIGLFHKDLSDYSGQSKFTDTSPNLHTPVGGALWNEALAKGCASGDTVCIRNYIFRTHPTAPGVTRGQDDASGNATGSIVGQQSDPLASFEINSFSNKQNATLHGAELNVQHMFGNSGFGLSANYTWVHSGLRYNNASIGEQFALVGLSNSYNLVGIYEDKKFSVRAAWNWRGEFLSSTFDGAGPNPNYTEPYGQLDLSVSYSLNDRLSFQFEAINLTDEIQRVHGRTKSEVLSVTQAGPRYMIGARYKF
jgi:TonB-dependent receptor